MNASSQDKSTPSTGEPDINYHALLEQATDAIMIKDLHGNFKDVSSALCTIFGYSKEELIQRNALALVEQRQLEESPPVWIY